MFSEAKEIINKFDTFIDESFFNDYHNWILWTPVIFACGILFYFLTEFTNFYILISSMFICILIAIFLRNNKKILTFSLCILIFLIGLTRAVYYVKSLEAPVIKYKMGYATIYGTVNDVSYYQKDNKTKTRIIVKIDKIEKYKNKNNLEKKHKYHNKKENYSKKLNSRKYKHNNKKQNRNYYKKYSYKKSKYKNEAKVESACNLKKDQRPINKFSAYYTKDCVMHNMPKYIRINMIEDGYKPKFGDYVKVNANLISIPDTPFPGAYNIKRDFYFKQIGGIGYNGYIVNHFKKINYTFYEKLKNKAYNTRENINNRIIESIGGNIGTIVGSFITGIRGKIPSDDMNNMTYAGLAHLIAISGLNMAIIMGLAFTVIRKILVQSEYLTLKFNLKKFSAFFAIVMGFLYLSITGFPVSANRAYIMACLYFMAIIIDKEPDIMRFLCLSGLLILFIQPDLILSPGFELSFFAVIGLVEGYKFLESKNIKTTTRIIYLKPFYYLFNTIISSVIAEISVTPLVIYYFNMYTQYNILSNMIAIPLAGFVTLPFATLSILLFPFHLEKILLVPSGWAIKIILQTSNYITHLPYSMHIISSPSLLGLSLIIFGFLWFMLWEQKWRYFGIILFISGILFSVFKNMPDVIIDEREELIILVSKNGDLYFSKEVNKYKTSIIEKKMGEINHKNLVQYDNKNIKQFDDEINYIFRNNDIVENFRNLNSKYKIIDKNYKVLLI